ncbi:hypothetical protein IAD21_02633 [Abditibacteriota bacterium]|nr:hypothetical protein IAD21_02633 [Abditibacteriota bacterium]
MKIASLLLNIFNILLLPGSVGLLIPSVMMFDAPGSEKKSGNWFVFWMFMLLPIVAIGSLVMGWWKWREGDYKTALKAGAVAPVYVSCAFGCLFTIYGK